MSVACRACATFGPRLLDEIHTQRELGSVKVSNRPEGREARGPHEMGFRFGALTGSSERRMGRSQKLGVCLLASDGRAYEFKAVPCVALIRH